MEQLIHITAAYSNAVLLVVLTNVSDFARKLDLPIPQPITASQVEKFVTTPSKDDIGGSLTLTNGDRFMFGHGYVVIFSAADDYYSAHPRVNITNLFEAMNMTTNEVIEYARNSLRKLGHEPKNMHADGPPTRFEGPDELWGRSIPHCQVEWRPEDARDIISVSINADKKRVVGLELISTNAWRPSPKPDIVPELEMDYQKRIQGKIFIRTNAPSYRPGNSFTPQPVPPAKK